MPPVLMDEERAIPFICDRGSGLHVTDEADTFLQTVRICLVVPLHDHFHA